MSYKQQIIKHFTQNDPYFEKTNTDNQYVTRCCLCGDSVKNMRKKRLNFKIDLMSQEPIKFKCFNCYESGYLTNKNKSMFGIPDNIILLDSNYKEYKDNYNDTLNYTIPKTNHDLSKLKYIHDRLKIKINTDDIYKFGIITNFREFIMFNRITTLNCKKEFAKYLQESYIGFLSKHKNCIYFRYIGKNNTSIRWYKYKLEKDDKMTSIYTISKPVDILCSDKIIVNLSEGVFDCISVYHNYDGDVNVAVGNGSYTSAIKELIYTGLFGKNVELHIYSDNDGNAFTKISYYKKEFKIFKYFFSNIIVHYNMKNKDFGFPIGDIDKVDCTIY